MDVRIIPGKLCGSVEAIASKSAAHRLLICAALAQGETEIVCPSLSRDIEATAACLRALGAGIDYSQGCFQVRPIERAVAGARLDCGESGSTLRFLLPVVCALGRGARIKMHGRLPQRPVSPLWEELCSHGARLSYCAGDEIDITGKLLPGKYSIRADVSSQFISGLLFALPLLGEASTLELVGNVESLGYIEMTRQALGHFGLEPGFDGSCFEIPGARLRSPGRVKTEGDWSNAAFWLVASRLSGGELSVTGLDEGSVQGDRAVTEAIERISTGDATIDCSNIPDLVPILSVLAAATKGRTEFVKAGRLRIKESDRIASVCRMLRALGGKCQEKAEGLVVEGSENGLRGGRVDGENDHRIVMSAAVAAIVCADSVTILGAEATDKSYPGFFEDYKRLGGQVQ